MAKYLILQSNLFMVITIVTIALFYLGLGNTSTTNVLALILIITFFGVPHGALDTLFAKKAFALNSIKKWLQFVSIYFDGGKGVTSGSDGSYSIVSKNSKLTTLNFSFVERSDTNCYFNTHLLFLNYYNILYYIFNNK
jgi:hypothetical protein